MANAWQEDAPLFTLHFISWSADVSHRADPANDIALNALYSTAFDRHLTSFDEDFRLVLSPKIKTKSGDVMIQEYFLNYAGKLSQGELCN